MHQTHTCHAQSLPIFPLRHPAASANLPSSPIASRASPATTPKPKPNNQEVPMSDLTTTTTYELDGKLISVHPDSVFRVQVGKGLKGPYRTLFALWGNLPRAVALYRAINIGRGYKKRLVYVQSRDSVLARAFS